MSTTTTTTRLPLIHTCWGSGGLELGAVLLFFVAFKRGFEDVLRCCSTFHRDKWSTGRMKCSLALDRIGQQNTRYTLILKSCLIRVRIGRQDSLRGG